MKRPPLFASSCLTCGARTPDGATYCGKHAGNAPQPQSEAERLARQPHRVEYRTPEYRAARARRYVMARGLCESCGVALKGRLHSDGVAWEYDHPHGDLDVHKARVRCLPCHHTKTAAERAARREEGQSDE